MNNPLLHRILAITLFVTIGLIGLYPTALLMFMPFASIPAPALLWLAWLTSLVGIVTSSVAVYQASKKRATSIAVTILSTLIVLATFSFIPFSQYASPGQDCMSGCITTYTSLTPRLLDTLEIVFAVDGCALLALLTLGFLRRPPKASRPKKNVRN